MTQTQDQKSRKRSHTFNSLPGLKARKIGTVAVLGGGLMGSGIATALAMSGIQVILKEINQKFLDVSLPTSRQGAHKHQTQRACVYVTIVNAEKTVLMTVQHRVATQNPFFLGGGGGGGWGQHIWQHDSTRSSSCGGI